MPVQRFVIGLIEVTEQTVVAGCLTFLRCVFRLAEVVSRCRDQNDKARAQCGLHVSKLRGLPPTDATHLRRLGRLEEEQMATVCRVEALGREFSIFEA